MRDLSVSLYHKTLIMQQNTAGHAKGQNRQYKTPPCYAKRSCTGIGVDSGKRRSFDPDAQKRHEAEREDRHRRWLASGGKQAVSTKRDVLHPIYPKGAVLWNFYI